MSDPHDREPDPAALDELLRAFGDGPEPTVEPRPVAGLDGPDAPEEALERLGRAGIGLADGEVAAPLLLGRGQPVQVEGDGVVERGDQR